MDRNTNNNISIITTIAIAVIKASNPSRTAWTLEPHGDTRSRLVNMIRRIRRCNSLVTVVSPRKAVTTVMDEGPKECPEWQGCKGPRWQGCKGCR
jgi:hypothetical protein